MTTPHNLGSTRGSDTTLNTSPIDTEKHNHTPDTASSLEHNIHDTTAPNADIEKEAAKADAEAGPAAPAPPNFMDPSSFPDGGLQAWLCLLGAFCAMFVSFGMLIIHFRWGTA
jgi:hypothetical protein